MPDKSQNLWGDSNGEKTFIRRMTYVGGIRGTWEPQRWNPESGKAEKRASGDQALSRSRRPSLFPLDRPGLGSGSLLAPFLVSHPKVPPPSKPVEESSFGPDVLSSDTQKPLLGLFVALGNSGTLGLPRAAPPATGGLWFF